MQKCKPAIIGIEEMLKKESVLQEHNYTKEEIIHLMKKMPRVTLKVFNLYIFNECTHKEISRLLGITESTSRWHLAEARKMLKLNASKIN